MPAITSKGQVTIPKRIRDALGLKPGSEVTFECRNPGEAVVRRGSKTVAKSRFARLRGSMKSGMTTDEILALTRGS